MSARQDEFIDEASDTIYQLSQDEMIRLQCEAREDYYRRQRSVQYQIEQLTNKNSLLQNENISLQNEIEDLQKQLSDALKLIDTMKESNFFS